MLDQHTHVTSREVRSTGPTWDQWDSSHPEVSYVLADGEFLCVTCANGGNGSIAGTSDETDSKWRIIGSQCNAHQVHCAHCDRIILPAIPHVWLTDARDRRSIESVYPAASLGQVHCGHRSNHDGSQLGCTRPNGHLGIHVAHNGTGDAVAVWE